MKRIRQRLASAIAYTYYAANLVIINKTRTVPIASPKDPISMQSTSCVIYKWECQCGASYLGRTERKLSVRMNEPVPRWLLQKRRGVATLAITKHIRECQQCENPKEGFSILFCAKNAVMLPFLEAIAIKHFQPALCKQKETVRTLKLSQCYNTIGIL